MSNETTYDYNRFERELLEIGFSAKEIEEIDNTWWASMNPVPKNKNYKELSYYSKFGYICYCPTCEKLRATTRSACMCGSCKSCNYRWWCIHPTFDDVSITTLPLIFALPSPEYII